MNSLHFIEAVSSVVIRRINHPRALTRTQGKAEVTKALMRELLKEHEESDVRQTCAVVLLRGGIPASVQGIGHSLIGRDERVRTCLGLRPGWHEERELQQIRGNLPTIERAATKWRVEITRVGAWWHAYKGALLRQLPRGLWIGCFREARRAILSTTATVTKRYQDEVRQNERLEIQQADAPLFGIITPEADAEKRRALAIRANYLRQVVSAAFSVDTSRERKANFRRAMRFARLATRTLSGRGHGMTEEFYAGRNGKDTRKKARKRTLAYLATGEAELTRRTLADAPFRKTRDCKSFAQLDALMNGILA